MAKLAKVILLVGFSFPANEGDYFAGYLSEGTNVHAMCSTLPETTAMLQDLLKEMSSEYPLTQDHVDALRELTDISNPDNYGQEIWWRRTTMEAWVESGVEFDDSYLETVEQINAPPIPLDFKEIPENRVDISFIAEVIVEQSLDVLADLTKEQIVAGLRDGTYATTLHHGEDEFIPSVIRVSDCEILAIIVSQTTASDSPSTYFDFNLINEDE